MVTVTLQRGGEAPFVPSDVQCRVSLTMHTIPMDIYVMHGYGAGGSIRLPAVGSIAAVGVPIQWVSLYMCSAIPPKAGNSGHVKPVAMVALQPQRPVTIELGITAA